MAEPVVGFLVAQLSDFISTNHERFKVHNAKVHVREIRSELMMMKSYLKDADANESKEERVGQWVREMKALAYRMEDVTETFVIRVESRNEMNINERSMKRILKKIIGPVAFYKVLLAVREINSEVEKIKSKLTILRQTKETYGITDHYPKSKELLVGMGEDVDLLVSSMVDKSRNYQIISICGMVEISRTILARQLCNDDRIQRHFQAVAWVYIPEELSTRIIFESIFCQFFNHPEQRRAIRDMEERELAERLLAFQQKRRCLIVLANIPSLHAWESLQIAFPFGKTASKILITTRSLEVAETAEKGVIHTMRNLTEEDAWALFSQYVPVRGVPEFNAVNSEMENIGRNEVTGRKVLPPGILALGETSTTTYALQQRNIVQENTEVQQALTSTYNDLPYQLKSCLFYLATFQKDTKIKPEKLYHLWMAEGLLSSDNYHSETMMHMAETYLNELHLRGMVYVQEEEVKTARSFKSCSLHDLVHDFCLFMGRQEEFFLVMENELEQDSDPSSWTDRTWRLVIYVGQHDNSKSLDRLNKNLRCLVVRNACKTQELDTHEMPSDLINCVVKWRCLRILDFDRIDFGSWTLPKGIANLVHLRYLSFMGCLLKKLPASICNLPYLQILDLRIRTGCKMEIPNILKKMKRLRHLYLPLTFETRGGVKLRLAGLTQLETLENFNTGVCDVEDLFTLTRISYLTVNIEASFEGLKRLADHMNMTSEHELHSSLSFRNFDCYAEERHSVFRQLLARPALHVLYMEGHLGQIPPSYKISKNLTKMVLSGSELQIDPMPTLEMLPNLGVLNLNDDAFIGKEIVCSASNFPELRHLELSNLCVLESWRVEEGAMPKLSTLVIENCSQLKMLPDGLGFLTNLRELKILRMPEKFKHRLREVDGERGADMDKVPRQTSIIFDNDNNESSG